jgi:hypothetical protein
MDRRNQLNLGIAAHARIEKLSKRDLILAAFVNIWDTELRLPQKGMVRPFEYLALLGNRLYDDLKGRSPVRCTKPVCLDLLDYLLNAVTYGSKVLQSFRPEKPRLVGSIGIITPA